jgi:hypothetical protein
MHLMKITISFNDKEVLSFDIIFIILLLLVYLFYLSKQALNKVCEFQDNSKSVTDNNENEINIQEIKTNLNKDDNDLIMEKSKENVDNNTFTERNKNEKGNMESVSERGKTQKQVKLEEEWMLIRKGRKQKIDSSKNK